MWDRVPEKNTVHKNGISTRANCKIVHAAKKGSVRYWKLRINWKVQGNVTMKQIMDGNSC